MRSDDITSEINKRIIEKVTGRRIERYNGVSVSIEFQSPEDKAKHFKRALLDYSIEKLDDTEENKVIVEDMGFIFSRLNEQFSCQKEKDAFYKNYAYCVLSAYEELTNTPLVWQIVTDSEPDGYPKIDQGYFQVTPTTSDEDATIWLCRQYDQELKKKEKEKIMKKSPKHYWW